MSVANKLVWSTEKRKINDLLPFDNNPRVMSEEEVMQLTKSLKKFDLVEIPVVDTDNRIVAGHQRIKVLQMLGRGDEIIDVRIPNRKLTDEEFREYNLRSNRNHGDFNWDMLVNFDTKELLDAGFEQSEMDRHFGDKPPQPKSLTVFYETDEMDEVRKVIYSFDGDTVSQRLLALIRSL